MYKLVNIIHEKVAHDLRKIIKLAILKKEKKNCIEAQIYVGLRELIETIPKCEILKILLHCESERAT